MLRPRFKPETSHLRTIAAQNLSAYSTRGVREKYTYIKQEKFYGYRGRDL
jgi:hypothetical protein